VIVRTGDVRGAGTDANVFIALHGKKGSTGSFFLETSSNNFERGACDEFAIRAADVGNIQSIEIGHDGE
jgi:lipoxygenase homology domain-containing protein 1